MFANRVFTILSTLLVLGCQRQGAQHSLPSDSPPPGPVASGEPVDAQENAPQNQGWARTFSSLHYYYLYPEKHWTGYPQDLYVTPSGSLCLYASHEQLEDIKIFDSTHQWIEARHEHIGEDNINFRSAVICYSSQGEYLWSRLFYDDQSGNELASLVFDDADNAYLAINFTSHKLYYGQEVPFTNNQSKKYDSVLLKISPRGETLWTQYITGKSDDRAESILLSPSGQVYVVGRFNSSPLKVGISHSLLPEGKDDGNNNDVLIARFEADDGDFIDMHQLGGEGDDFPGRPYLDSKGRLNLLVDAPDSSYLSFNGQKFTPEFPQLPQDGKGDRAYLLQLSADLTQVEWSHRIDGILKEDSLRSLVLNHGYDAQSNTVLFFSFASRENYQGIYIDGLLRSVSRGDEDYAILKLDADGKEIFYDHLGSSGWEGVPYWSGLDNSPTHYFSPLYNFDGQNNLLVAAQFERALLFLERSNTFLPGMYTPDWFYPDESFLMDWFVVKYGPSGELIWKRSFPSHGNENIDFIDSDPQGNVYFGGTFSLSKDLDFGDGDKIGIDDPFQSQPKAQAFIATYDPLGKLLWKKIFKTEGWQQSVQPSQCRSVGATSMEEYSFLIPGKIAYFAGSDEIYMRPDPSPSVWTLIKFNPDGTLNFVQEFTTDAFRFDNGGCLVDEHGLLIFQGNFEGDLLRPYPIKGDDDQWKRVIMKVKPESIVDIIHKSKKKQWQGSDVLIAEPPTPDPPQPFDKLKLKNK